MIFGAAYDDSLGDQLRVTVIATGLRRGARQQTLPLTVVQPTAQQALRTGTGNLPIPNHVLATPQQGATGQPQQPDDGNLSTPSVWRTNRHHAAAKARGAVEQRHGRDRDPGLPAQAGGLNGPWPRGGPPMRPAEGGRRQPPRLKDCTRPRSVTLQV